MLYHTLQCASTFTPAAHLSPAHAHLNMHSNTSFQGLYNLTIWAWLLFSLPKHWGFSSLSGWESKRNKNTRTLTIPPLSVWIKKSLQASSRFLTVKRIFLISHNITAAPSLIAFLPNTFKSKTASDCVSLHVAYTAQCDRVDLSSARMSAFNQRASNWLIVEHCIMFN